MDPVLFGQILAMCFIIMMTLVCTSLAIGIGSFIDGTGALQAMVGYALWLFAFCAICGIFGHFEWFDKTIYAGMPWPYVVSFIFLFIPVLNHTRVSGVLVVWTFAIFLTKVYWMTR